MELVINFSGGKDSSAMLAYLCEKYQRIVDLEQEIGFTMQSGHSISECIELNNRTVGNEKRKDVRSYEHKTNG